MSPEIWSLIAVALGTGATILIGMVSVMLKLWGETNKRFDRQDERIATLDASLRAEIHATNERIEASNASLQAEIHATNERIEASNASLRAEIHALRTENSQRFAQIEQRFIQMDDRFTQTERRFFQIEQQLDRLSERQHADISAVNARLDALVLSQGTLAAALAPQPGEQQAPPHAAAPPQPVPASQPVEA